jgi:hypothetical protein
VCISSNAFKCFALIESTSGWLSLPDKDTAAMTNKRIDVTMSMRFIKIDFPKGWQLETQIYQ